MRHLRIDTFKSLSIQSKNKMDNLQKRQQKANKINLSEDRRVSTNDIRAELVVNPKDDQVSPKSGSQILSVGQFDQNVVKQLNQCDESQISDANQRLKGLSGSQYCGNSSQNTGDFPGNQLQNKLASQVKSGIQDSFYPSSEQLQDITGPQLEDGEVLPSDDLGEIGQNYPKRKSSEQQVDPLVGQTNQGRSSTPLEFGKQEQDASMNDTSQLTVTPLALKVQKPNLVAELSGDQKVQCNSSLMQSFGRRGVQQVTDQNNLKILSQKMVEESKINQSQTQIEIKADPATTGLAFKLNLDQKPDIDINSPEDILNPYRNIPPQGTTISQFELQGTAADQVQSSQDGLVSNNSQSSIPESPNIQTVGTEQENKGLSDETQVQIEYVPRLKNKTSSFACDGEFSLGAAAHRNPHQTFEFAFANQEIKQRAVCEIIIQDDTNSQPQYEDQADPSSALPKIYSIENEYDLRQNVNPHNSSVKQLTEQSDRNMNHQASEVDKSQSIGAKGFLHHRLQLKTVANINNTESFGVIQSNSHQSLGSDLAIEAHKKQKLNTVSSIGQLGNHNDQKESYRRIDQSNSLSRDSADHFVLNFDQNQLASKTTQKQDITSPENEDNFLVVPSKQQTSSKKNEHLMLQEESPQILADIMRGKQKLQGLKTQPSHQQKNVSVSSQQARETPSQASSGNQKKQRTLRDGTNSSVHDAGVESILAGSEINKKDTLAVETSQRGQATFNGQQNRKQKLSVEKIKVKESNITDTPGFPRQQCSIKEKVGRLASKRHQERNQNSGGSRDTGSGDKVQVRSRNHEQQLKNDMLSSSGEEIPIDPRKIQKQIQGLSSDYKQSDSPQAQTLGKASHVAISESRQNFNNLATRYAQGVDLREGCHTTQRSKFSIASMSGLGFVENEINSDYQDSQSPRVHHQEARGDSKLQQEVNNAQQIDFWTKQPKISGPTVSGAADDSPRRSGKRASHRYQTQKGNIKIFFGAPLHDQIKSEALSNGESKRKPFSMAGHSINSPGETYNDQSAPFMQRRSRNRNIKARKFYNSMSKLDRINVMPDQANQVEDQISLNFIRVESLMDDTEFFLGHNGNVFQPQRKQSGQTGIIILSPVAQDRKNSQSPQSPVYATNGTEEIKDSGIFRRMSSHEEQVQGSKTSMSDLVGEVLDRNATNSFNFAQQLQRGRTYTFHKGSNDDGSGLERTRNKKVLRDQWKHPLEDGMNIISSQASRRGDSSKGKLHAIGPNQSFNEELGRL